MAAPHYASVSDARAHFKSLFDAAEQGGVSTIARNAERVAVVDADRLRYALSCLTRSAAQVVHEEGEWAAFLPGLPVHAVADTLDGAIDELVDALREYVADWHSRLRVAANHDHWGLVQLIELSSDEQLRDWITAAS